MKNKSKKKVSVVDGTFVNPQGYEYTIPIQNKKLISKITETCIPPTSPGKVRKFAYQSFINVNMHLPFYIRNKLLDCKAGIITPKYVYIKGLPIDNDLPETPIDGKWSKNKRSFKSEACLLGIAQLIGIPYAFQQEKDGKLIHQIVPVQGQESSLSSAGSVVNLGFHTEAAFDKTLRPDFVILICLRSDFEKNAKTTIVDIRDVIKHLDQKSIEELSKPNFITRIPVSFTDAGAKTEWSDPLPIISNNKETPQFIFDTYLTKSIKKSSENALTKLIKILNTESIQTTFYLEKGDCLIIPNRTCVHGRTSFQPRFDGKDRWLQRVYVIQDTWNGRNRKLPNFNIFT